MKFDKEQMKRDLDESKRRGGKIIHLEPGRTVIRLLSTNSEIPYRRTAFHYFVGEDSKSRACCPKVTSEQPCPICEQVSRLKKAGHPDAKKVSARRQYLFNVVVRGQEEQGPQVLQVPITVWREIVAYICDEDDPLPLFDVEDGFDVVIIREGTGFQTQYQVKPRTRPSPLGDSAEASRWLEEQEDLEKLVQRMVKTEEELLGLVPASPQEEMDDDIPF